MKGRDLTSRMRLGFLAAAVSLGVLPVPRPVQAAPPVITVDAAGVRVMIAAAPLSEAIDALARAAGFKVTYDGARPTAMLFNTEIGTPTVAEALFRLLDGQGLNYGVVFDRTGRNVTLLMMLGPASKRVSVPPTGPVSPNPRPFPAPRTPRNDVPLLDEEPEEAEAPEPEPEVPQNGSQAAPPAIEEQAPGGGQQPVALPPSPFGPSPPGLRPLVVSPFLPRFQPSPAPSPSPSPSP